MTKIKQAVRLSAVIFFGFLAGVGILDMGIQLATNGEEKFIQHQWCHATRSEPCHE